MAVLVNETMNTAPATGTLSGESGGAFWVDDGGGEGHLQLTTATSFSSVWRGQWHFSGSLAQNFYSRWQHRAGGGSGAESEQLFWGASSVPNQEDDAVGQYAVVLNEQADQVQVRFNGTNIHTQAFANIDNNTWRDVEVFVNGQNIIVEIDNVQIVNFTDGTVRTLGGTIYGWGGRNGGGNNIHDMREAYLEAPQASATASNLFFF